MDNLNHSHGGNIYEIKRKYKKEIIDFSANINPLGLPQEVKKYIYKNFNRVLHYPDIHSRDIKRKIAKYWGIDEKNVLLGNGSAELIYLIFSAFRPRTTLIPAPTFSEYERAAKSVNSKVRFLRLKEKEGFKLCRQEYPKADILFLCNPNNPTGNFMLGGQRPKGGLLVIDETFMDFLPDQNKHSLIHEAPKSRKVIVLRTFTKFFALPGLRVGYLIAHDDTVKTLRKYQIPWSTNAFAQMAAEIVLDNKTYAQKTRQLIKKEREFLFNEVTKIKKLAIYPSVTNFLLIKIKDNGLNSSLLRKRLIQKGILIRDCANFKGLSNKFIRIAVRNRGENRKLIKALKEAI